MPSMVGCSGFHVVDVVVGDKRIVENQREFSWKGIIHSVGQEFEGGVPAFRIALATYAVECDFAVNYLKNDATRVTAECIMKLSTGCKWFVHRKVLMNSGVDKVRGGLFGDFATSFDQLRWYLETAMRTNPGSVFELDVDESSGCFRRLFVAFHGYLYGFQFCRPLLFVNGTFLKGHLLVATSKDGNQGLFPLAFTIVDAENQDNWMWFLSQLLKAVGSGQRLTFVSDLPSSERFDFDGAVSSITKPPITKKQPGQNKKKRIPSRGENVKQIKCGRCLKYGNHNKKTCKAAI
ncbi:hypothetical protein ACSBR2_009168 [Camellia fascicularis]